MYAFLASIGSEVFCRAIGPDREEDARRSSACTAVLIASAMAMAILVVAGPATGLTIQRTSVWFDAYAKADDDARMDPPFAIEDDQTVVDATSASATASAGSSFASGFASGSLSLSVVGNTIGFDGNGTASGSESIPEAFGWGG